MNYIKEDTAKILFKEFAELENPAEVFLYEKYQEYLEDLADFYADSDYLIAIPDND